MAWRQYGVCFMTTSLWSELWRRHFGTARSNSSRDSYSSPETTLYSRPENVVS
jgi:hypothetical protein